MKGGYIGRILRVDLSGGKIVKEDLPEEKILRKFVGGTGLGVKMLHDDLPVDTRPLDPENRLIFMTGPMTGTPYPSASDTSCVTLNANTGYTIGDSHTHGFLGPFLKMAGYDALIVQGACDKPAYLWIHDDKVEIRDAADVWGHDTHESEDLIKAKLGMPHDVSVAAIGPAGENLIHGAGIGNDKYHMFCKCGVGLIMGSKKLKAIVVKGTGTIPIADPKGLLEVNRKWFDIAFKQGMHPGLYHGAKVGVEMFDIIADWTVVKNMHYPAEGPEWGKTMYAHIHDVFKTKHTACWACPVACSYRSELTVGPHKGKTITLGGGGEGREGAAGIVGINEPGTVFYLTDLNDRMGIDSAETGCCMGLAFELYERGLLTKEQTDGLELTWGNAEAAEALFRKIINREGFGKIFAEGAKKAAEILGGDAHKYVIHVKGAGYNMHDWRTAWGILLGQITAGAPGTWQGGFANDMFPQWDLGYKETTPRFRAEGVAEVTAKAQLKRIWDDCYGQCFLAGMAEQDSKHAFLMVEALKATTGWNDFSHEETLEVGHRVITLERIFNMKHGLTAKSDLDIGQRLLDEPTEGAAEGKSMMPYLKDMIKDYYEYMGWDRETGRPTPETIDKLGLTEEARGL